MDQEGTSSFYVIDKQTSSHIVWRCTYKSCSGRLKVCREDSKVISSKPHNHDIEPRSKAAVNQIENIFCVKMNKFVVAVAVAIALLVGAIFGGLVGHYSTLYTLGYYEESPNNDDLSSTMAMVNGKSNLIDGRTNNNFNNQDLVNQDVVPRDGFSNDVGQHSNIFHDTHNENVFHENKGITDQDYPQDTFSDNLSHQDNRFPITHNENTFQQNERNSFETVISDSNSFNSQLNSNNNPNVHNQGINHVNNHPNQNGGVNQQRSNEFQQNTNTNTIQNQANEFLNHNRGNAGFHHNTQHSSNHRFQLNDGNQNQRDHNQHQQNIQRNINLQRQQTQLLNQDHIHGNANQNVHQKQHIIGHSLNHGVNQQTNRNTNTKGVNRQQFHPMNNDKMEMLSTGPSHALNHGANQQATRNANLQNVNREQFLRDKMGILSAGPSHSLNHGANQQTSRNAHLQNVNRQQLPTMNKDDMKMLSVGPSQLSNHGANQQTNSNANPQNVNRKQFLPVDDEEMEIVSAGRSFQSSFTLQSMSMIKEEDNIGISTTTLKTPTTGIRLDQSSSQRKEQMSFAGTESSDDLSIIKATTIPINLSGSSTNEGSSKSFNAFLSTVTEKTVIQTPIALENTRSQKENVRKATGFNPNFNQNQAAIITERPATDISNSRGDVVIHTPRGGGQSFSKLFGINVGGENVNEGFSIGQDVKLTMEQSSVSLNQDTTLSPNKDFNSHTDTALINKEGISMVTEGLSMAVLGLSIIDHNTNPQNIDLKNKIDKMQDAISHIHLPPSLNISHRFSLGASSHNSEGISFGFAKSQATLPSQINENTTPLENKRLLVPKMPHQIMPTPLSHSFRGTNINQPMPSLLSPSVQGSNSKQLFPTSVSSQNRNSNSKQIFPNPASHSVQGSNPRQLVPTPLSPNNHASNHRQLVPTPLSPQVRGSNPRQLVPTSVSPQIQGSNPKQIVPTPLFPNNHGSNPGQLVPTPLSQNNHVSNPRKLVPTSLSPQIQGSNPKQLAPTPLFPNNQGSNPGQLVPTPLSPQNQGSNSKQLVSAPLSPIIQKSNSKQLISLPLSPEIQVSNTKQFVPTSESSQIQQSNTNKNVPSLSSTPANNEGISFGFAKSPAILSSPVSPPADGLAKFAPTPISPKIGLTSQSDPIQEHQAAQQQSLFSNTGEKVRSKAAHESNSKHKNWSNSGKLTKEEIKNYILKSVSTENLRNNLKELSRLPHQAGSAREKQLANLIKERFLSSGFDMAELVPYDVLLSKPDPTQNNRVSLHTEGGVGEEVWAAQSVILPSEELQAYSAYSPSGKVMTAKGEAVVYANYGQKEDFEYLDSIGISLSGRVVMARNVIYVTGMELVKRAASRGARGVILYSDPAEAVNPGDTTVYPNSTSLPGDAVQYRKIRSGQGDPLTPGWPSKPNSHRLLEEDINSLPRIPVQPISYNDARVILQKLGGPASPIAWHGDLTGVSYNIGPTLTSDFAHLNLCLATYNQRNRTTIYNVIGTIQGEVEPDRYVILGNHRDAWAYGAIDPSSGTSQMLETAAVIGQLLAKGWRPRRTIVFASWGAEEFGKIGSTEWVEEHVSKLQERGVAYINVDICSTGPILAHAASPTLRDVLVNMAKLVPGMGSSGTVYDEWREYSLRVDKTEPKPWHLGTGTDFSAFSFFGGVPSMGMGFMRNSSANDVPMYPAYHTGIETFDLVDRFIDPGFTIHQGCSRLSSLTLVHLAESPVLPLDPHYLAQTMEEALREMKRKGIADVLMGTLGVQTLPALEESILSFKLAANAFQTRLRNPISNKNPLILRGINDQLTRLEQKFLMPQGSEEKPWCRQAVFAPSPGSPFGKWGFPALKDLLNDLVGHVNLHGIELSQRHHLIEKHVSDLILMTDSAISSLNHLHII